MPCARLFRKPVNVSSIARSAIAVQRRGTLCATPIRNGPKMFFFGGGGASDFFSADIFFKSGNTVGEKRKSAERRNSYRLCSKKKTTTKQQQKNKQPHLAQFQISNDLTSMQGTMKNYLALYIYAQTYTYTHTHTHTHTHTLSRGTEGKGDQSLICTITLPHWLSG